MTFARGGVLLAHAPDMLFLKDTDGDDRADIRKVLFTGFGTGDTHAGPSNLRYGLDNWIYGTVGYSRFNGEVGGENSTLDQVLFVSSRRIEDGISSSVQQQHLGYRIQRAG